MYSNESTLLQTQWLVFTNLYGPKFNKLEAKMDRATLTQFDLIGWWIWHGKDIVELRMFVICLFSLVVNYFVVERN